MAFVFEDNDVFRFLRKTRFENVFIQFDYWLVLHFFAGVLLSLFFTNLLLVFIILILYELFEFVFIGVFFRGESMLNIFWDLVFGMGGFLVGSNLIGVII